MNSPQRIRDTGRHLLDGMFWVLLAEALFPITGMITAGALTRNLSTEEYGRLNLCAVFTSWLSILINSLFGGATALTIHRLKDWQRTSISLFRYQLVTGIMVGLLTALFSGPIARACQLPQLQSDLQLMSLEIPFFSTASFLRYVLIARSQFRQRALTGAIRWLFRMVIVLIMIETGFGVQGVIVGFLFTSLLELIVAWRMVELPLFWGEGTAICWREFFGLAGPLCLVTICLQTFDRVGIFSLQYFGSDEIKTAFYGAAQNLASAPATLVSSAMGLSLWSTSRLLASGDRLRGIQLAENSVRVGLLLIPLAAVLSGSSEQIIPFIYGWKFIDAAPIFRLLIFAYIGIVQVSIVLSLLTSFQQARLQLMIAGPLAPLALLVCCFVVPTWKAVGAAGTIAVISWLSVLFGWSVLFRLTGVRIPIWTLVRSILLASVVYLLADRWQTTGLGILWKLPILALLVGIGFLVLGEIREDELQ